MNAHATTSARFRAAVDASSKDWEITEDAERRWRRDVGVATSASAKLCCGC